MRTLLASLLLCACSGGASPPEPPAAPPPPAAPAPPAPASAEAPAAAGMVCAAAIVVAWRGADHAAETVTRTEEEARARAEELLARIGRGEDFAAVARAESDAHSSGPRGGLLGTYTAEDWPPTHEPIRATVWALGIGETSQVLHAPYGWVIARRLPVELLHTRHILIRYAGARNAGPEVTRTRDEARVEAQRLWNELQAAGADFAAVARAHGEDGSAERGGDLGTLGRGRLSAPYEAAAFGLAIDAISTPVESDFGFHLIQRLAL